MIENLPDIEVDQLLGALALFSGISLVNAGQIHGGILVQRPRFR